MMTATDDEEVQVFAVVEHEETPPAAEDMPNEDQPVVNGRDNIVGDDIVVEPPPPPEEEYVAFIEEDASVFESYSVMDEETEQDVFSVLINSEDDGDGDGDSGAHHTTGNITEDDVEEVFNGSNNNDTDGDHNNNTEVDLELGMPLQDLDSSNDDDDEEEEEEDGEEEDTMDANAVNNNNNNETTTTRQRASWQRRAIYWTRFVLHIVLFPVLVITSVAIPILIVMFCFALMFVAMVVLLCVYYCCSPRRGDQAAVPFHVLIRQILEAVEDETNGLGDASSETPKHSREEIRNSLVRRKLVQFECSQLDGTVIPDPEPTDEATREERMHQDMFPVISELKKASPIVINTSEGNNEEEVKATGLRGRLRQRFSSRRRRKSSKKNVQVTDHNKSYELRMAQQKITFQTDPTSNNSKLFLVHRKFVFSPPLGPGTTTTNRDNSNNDTEANNATTETRSANYNLGVPAMAEAESSSASSSGNIMRLLGASSSSSSSSDDDDDDDGWAGGRANAAAQSSDESYLLDEDDTDTNEPPNNNNDIEEQAPVGGDSTTHDTDDKGKAIESQPSAASDSSGQEREEPAEQIDSQTSDGVAESATADGKALDDDQSSNVVETSPEGRFVERHDPPGNKMELGARDVIHPFVVVPPDDPIEDSNKTDTIQSSAVTPHPLEAGNKIKLEASDDVRPFAVSPRPLEDEAASTPCEETDNHPLTCDPSLLTGQPPTDKGIDLEKNIHLGALSPSGVDEPRMHATLPSSEETKTEITDGEPSTSGENYHELASPLTADDNAGSGPVENEATPVDVNLGNGTTDETAAAAAATINSTKSAAATCTEHRGVSSYCNICLLEYEVGDIVVWSGRPHGCHHVFHEECLLDWLQRKPTCPNCRQEFFAIEDTPASSSSSPANDNNNDENSLVDGNHSIIPESEHMVPESSGHSSRFW